jgi:transposase-like protein
MPVNERLMTCKHCNSPKTVKYGKKGEVQYYRCKECGRKFSGIDAPPGMRHSKARIGEALGLFYDGLSLSDISRHFIATSGEYIDPSNVWRWVMMYSKRADLILGNLTVKTSPEIGRANNSRSGWRELRRAVSPR